MYVVTRVQENVSEKLQVHHLTSLEMRFLDVRDYSTAYLFVDDSSIYSVYTYKMFVSVLGGGEEKQNWW